MRKLHTLVLSLMAIVLLLIGTPLLVATVASAETESTTSAQMSDRIPADDLQALFTMGFSHAGSGQAAHASSPWPIPVSILGSDAPIFSTSSLPWFDVMKTYSWKEVFGTYSVLVALRGFQREGGPTPAAQTAILFGRMSTIALAILCSFLGWQALKHCFGWVRGRGLRYWIDDSTAKAQLLLTKVRAGGGQMYRYTPRPFAACTLGRLNVLLLRNACLVAPIFGLSRQPAGGHQAREAPMLSQEAINGRNWFARCSNTKIWQGSW